MRGGYGSGSYGSLEERINGALERQPERSVDANAAPVLASPARHCYVNGQPSLLVEWRRTTTGWEGRVITVRWLDGQGWASVESWLAALEITQMPEEA